MPWKDKSKHRDHISTYSREYYLKHHSKINRRHKAYRERDRSKAIVWARKWRLANPTRTREIAWKCWGIRNADGSFFTYKDYESLLIKQGGGCAFCGRTAGVGTRNKTLHVDHNHKTGVVRGLICHKCNMMLSSARDNIQILLAAVKYLRRFTK